MYFSLINNSIHFYSQFAKTDYLKKKGGSLFGFVILIAAKIHLESISAVF